MGATNVQMACVPYPEDNQQLDLKWKKRNWGAGININRKQWSSQTVSLSRLWNYSETQEGILTALCLNLYPIKEGILAVKLC